MDITDLYDEIDDAPVLKFDKPPITHSGTVVKAERVDDKYAPDQIPAFTLRLDKPTDDGDKCGVILRRSELMQRMIGKAVRRTGRSTVEVGDWLSVTFVEQRESSGGDNYKFYEVEYRPGDPPSGTALSAAASPATPTTSRASDDCGVRHRRSAALPRTQPVRRRTAESG